MVGFMRLPTARGLARNDYAVDRVVRKAMSI
jgi:hypothetical protein